MKWPIRLGKYAGIDLFMQFTFILLSGWIALMHWRQSHSVSAVVACNPSIQQNVGEKDAKENTDSC